MERRVRAVDQRDVVLGGAGLGTVASAAPRSRSTAPAPNARVSVTTPALARDEAQSPRPVVAGLLLSARSGTRAAPAPIEDRQVR